MVKNDFKMPTTNKQPQIKIYKKFLIFEYFLTKKKLLNVKNSSKKKKIF